MSRNSRIVVIIGIILITIIIGYWKKQKEITFVPLDLKKQLDSRTINSLEVETTITKVNILPSESKQIEIHLHGEINQSIADELETDVETDGETAKIIVKTPTSFSNVDTTKHQLDIRLPKKAYDEVEISSKLGYLQVGNITTKHLYMEVNQGNIYLDHVQGKEMELQVNVGEINVSETRGKIDAEIDQGNVNLNLPEVLDDINVDGDVSEIKLVTRSPLQYETNSDHEVIAQVGKAGPRIELDTDQGNINVSQ